ncbi:protein kinase [Maudiozyma humilis]|uniref:non-specific serine/threonine protein kinase n=1 Tax=Maudiozyma humilis TaxID=51915 RepID=A0AAV5RT90_MAUHU|nr:protein kinase [Kazachstania humilis]
MSEGDRSDAESHGSSHVSSHDSSQGSSADYDNYIRIATENTLSMVLELDMDGLLKYISAPQWEALLSTPPPTPGTRFSDYVEGSPQDKAVFRSAVEMMLENDNVSYTVTFNVRNAAGDLQPLEACGILIHSDTQTYSMWNVKPYNEQWHGEQLDQVLPAEFIKKLGFGATVFADYLHDVEESRAIVDADLPLPRTELCRVCENFVPAWWLETHSQNCVVEHRIESAVQLIHDNLVEQRAVLRNFEETIESSNDTTAPLQYKDTQITLGSDRIRRVQNVLSALDELAEFAVNINTSEMLTATDNMAEFQFSPATRNNIQRIQNWHQSFDIQQYSQGANDDNDDDDTNIDGLRLLIDDTMHLARRKVDAVLRLDNALKYGQRIKDEVNDVALQLIREQLQNNRISKAHELSVQFSNDNASSTTSLPTLAMASPEVEYNSVDSLLHKLPSRHMMQDGNDNNIQDTIPEQQLSSALTFPNHSTESFNTLDGRSGDVPRLVTPQPKHAKNTLFSDSYLKDDELPKAGLRMRQRPSEEGGSSSTNTTSVTPLENRGTPDHYTGKFPRYTSRSITPSMQVDYDMYQSDASHEHNSTVDSANMNLSNNNNSSFNSTSNSNSSFHTPRVSSGSKMNPSQAPGQSQPNITINLPKLSTTISLTPRRGSPLPSNMSAFNNQKGSTPNVFNDPQLNHYNNSIHFNNSLSTQGHGHSRSAIEKSPISSPFAMARDFLTPEQFPNTSASPSQPLSPLLLATNQIKTAAPSIRDYDILKPISRGAYGSVYLARKKLTGDYFAIKALRKSDMIAKNQVMNVKSERAIMMFQSDKPYVAKLFATFQNKDNLFLVMEYLPGGDLATLIKMMGTLPDEWVRQYLAEIIVGVEDMHQNGIIHHDLKPDNLLIDSNGHIKLTDFGLSRAGLIRRHKVSNRSRSITSNTIDEARSLSQSHSQESAAPDQKGLGIARPKKTSISSLKSHEFGSTGPSSPRVESIQNSELAAMNKNDSQMSLSLFEVSRSSTPPPQAMTSCSTPSNPRPDAVSNADYSSSGTQIPTIKRKSHSNSISTVSSVTSHTSDMALFHPDDTKQDKKFFGTPDYLAPETIEGTGEGDECDWWSLGCILFELLLGYPPFHANTPEAVFRNILADNIQWPTFENPEEEAEFVSKDAKDLITKLLVLDPSKRLGVNGAQEIKDHPYFKTIDWSNVYDEEPSFVPAIENPENTEYFDSRGAVLENLGDSDDDNQDPNSGYNLHDNSDIPDINSTSGLSLNMTKGTPTFSTPRKWSGSSLQETGDKNSPINKLSISSVLESVVSPQNAGQSENSSRNSSVPKSMSLAIPPHMRERRTSKLNESQTEFGSFYFRNLSALDKANKDVINRLKSEHLSDAPRAHRRTSSSSMAGSSSDNSSTKLKVTKGTLIGSPAINPTTKNMFRSDSSSIRSFSPDRSISLDHVPTPLSRKGSIISNIELNTPVTSSVNGIAVKSPNALFFNEADSPTTSKFRSPLSPASNTFTKVGRNKAPSKSTTNTPQRASVVDMSSDEADRLQAVARVNSLRYRRKSGRRASSNSANVIGYHIDVLLCEPIPIHRYRATRDLESMGCTVVVASTGDEIISKATSGIKFDLIFLPLKLVNFSVFDIVKLIKHTNDVNAHTPIIAVTNYYQEAVSTNMFDDVMEKPVDAAQLHRILLKYSLKRSQEEAENTIMSDSDEASSAIMR